MMPEQIDKTIQDMIAAGKQPSEIQRELNQLGLSITFLELKLKLSELGLVPIQPDTPVVKKPDVLAAEKAVKDETSFTDGVLTFADFDDRPVMDGYVLTGRSSWSSGAACIFGLTPSAVIKYFLIDTPPTPGPSPGELKQLVRWVNDTLKHYRQEAEQLRQNTPPPPTINITPPPAPPTTMVDNTDGISEFFKH